MKKFWKSKKQKEAAKTKPENIYKSDVQQPQSKVVNQQTSMVDVDPAFFDYEKVKFNEFLTDSDEYKTKVLVNDYPNADPRYAKVSKDYIDLQTRREKDEKAFKEIYTNLENNNKYSEMQFESTKRLSLANANYLHNNVSERPIKTLAVDAQFFNDVGKKIDERSQILSEKTEKFLKEMHTKVLDLNNLTEPLISKGTDYGIGAKNTTKSYLLDNTIVNSYDKLKKAHDAKYANLNESILSPSDFQNLSNIKKTESLPVQNNLYQNDALIERTKNLQNADIVPTRKLNTTINFSEINDPSTSSQTTINFNDSKTQNLFANELLDEAKTIDKIVVREINKEVEAYENNQKNMHKTLELLLQDQEQNHDNSFNSIKRDNLEDLIPLNEIKMDLRIRKAEKRHFNILNKGTI